MTRFISIISGKGGVGKTTVAVNLGSALRRAGVDVTLLDANLTTPDLGVYFGILNFPVNLGHVFKGLNEVTEAIYRHPAGFNLIPADLNCSKLLCEEADFKQIFHKLNGLSEIVLVDSPAGLGRDVEKIVKNSGEAIIVTNPDTISATNALKSIRLAEEHNVSILGVVLNRTGRYSHELDAASLESLLGYPVIAEIPEHASIVNARMERRALNFSSGDKASAQFKMLADKIGNLS